MVGAKEQGATFVQDRWLVIPRTLCFVRNGDAVLLMKRAAHKRIFPNRYNGLGGHLERDEDPLTGVVREVQEESGLNVYDVRLRGVYNVDAGAETGIVVFAFTAWSDTRTVMDCDEGTLEWVAAKSVSDYDLVDDLRTMLPRWLTASEDAPPDFVHLSYNENDELVIRLAGNDE